MSDSGAVNLKVFFLPVGRLLAPPRPVSPKPKRRKCFVPLRFGPARSGTARRPLGGRQSQPWLRAKISGGPCPAGGHSGRGGPAPWGSRRRRTGRGGRHTSTAPGSGGTVSGGRCAG